MQTKKLLTTFIFAVIFFALGAGIFWFGASLKNNKENKNNQTASSILFNEAVGKKAPDFSLRDINGAAISLNELKGKNIVLFFNEGLMCYPACLDQVVSLSKDERFNDGQTVSYSVVVDSSENWKKALASYPYLKDAKVLFDDGGKISRAYNVLSLPSSMHKGLFPGHTYFIIDKDGVIRFNLDDPYMAERNNELFDEIEKL